MIEQAIQAALIAASPALRVYPDVAAQEAVAPFVVFTIIGGSNDMHMLGDGGTRGRLIQVDVWADTRKVASNLMLSCCEQMQASIRFSVVSIDETGADRYDDAEKLYRSSYEFGIRYQNDAD